MKSFFTVLFALIIVNALWAKPYFQQEVHYKIDVTLHAENNTYSGHEQVVYVNHSPDTLTFIWFHLYPNAYRNNNTPFARQEKRFCNSYFYFSKKKDRGYLDLQSVEAHNQPLTFTYNGEAIDEVKILLPEPLAPGDSVTLNLKFQGKFPIVFSRMGHWGKYHFAATQWYPKVVVYDRFGWHPDSYLNQGEFYGEYGTFDVSITLPESFVIDATGMLINSPREKAFMKRIADTTAYFLTLNRHERKAFIRRWMASKQKNLNLKKMKTVHFHAENVHNFAWFAGYDYMVLRKVHNHGVLTNVLVQPRMAYAWRRVPEYAKRTVAFYSKHVGPFQYPKASVVQGALKAGGGMEYPMITIISSPATPGTHLLEMVVMHEIGHNWFMGMLGSDERRSTFLDEGMNSFLEMKYMEYYYGKYNLTDFSQWFAGHHILNDIGEWQVMNMSYGSKLSMRDDQPLDLRAEAYSPSNYGAINYHKGALMLLALENYLTPKVFWQGMHEYYRRWNGKHPTVEDFFAVMSDVAQKDLSWFFKDWYRSTKYCDFVIDRTHSESHNGKMETAVFVRNKGTMKDMPANVALVTATGDTLLKRWNADPNKPVIFEHKGKVKFAEVNPKHKIFETSYLNNRSTLPPFKVHLLIPQIPDFEHYEINILPYYWYEPFVDRHRVGTVFWGGNPVFQQWFWGGHAYFATQSKKVGYSLFLSNRFHPSFANYADAKAEVMNTDGMKRISLSVSNHFLHPDNDCISKSLTVRADALDLYDPAYYESSMFQKAKYTALTATAQWEKRTMLSQMNVSFSIHKGIGISGSEVDFWKIESQAGLSHRFSRQTRISLQAYAGSVMGNNIPLQESIFAAGDVDARHLSFAFARRGRLAPNRRFVFGRGMNMYSYNQADGRFFNGKSGAALHLDLDVWRFLPTLYGSVALLGTSNLDMITQKPFAEFGAKLSLFKTRLIFPLYLTNPAPGEKHFAFRFLFSYSFSLGFRY